MSVEEDGRWEGEKMRRSPPTLKLRRMKMGGDARRRWALGRGEDETEDEKYRNHVEAHGRASLDNSRKQEYYNEQ